MKCQAGSIDTTADTQPAAVADSLPQCQFHPGTDYQAASTARDQLTGAQSIRVLQRKHTAIQYHAAAVVVGATQRDCTARYHAGASAQRSGNLTRLRHQHTTAHRAAQRHCLVHRHRARRCRKRIGRSIHQQRAAAHLDGIESTTRRHILQNLAHRDRM